MCARSCCRQNSSSVSWVRIPRGPPSSLSLPCMCRLGSKFAGVLRRFRTEAHQRTQSFGRLSVGKRGFSLFGSEAVRFGERPSRSAADEPLLLTPLRRQLDGAAGEPRNGQVDRLLAVEDRLDNVRRQEGEGE